MSAVQYPPAALELVKVPEQAQINPAPIKERGLIGETVAWMRNAEGVCQKTLVFAAAFFASVLLLAIPVAGWFFLYQGIVEHARQNQEAESNETAIKLFARSQEEQAAAHVNNYKEMFTGINVVDGPALQSIYDALDPSLKIEANPVVRTANDVLVWAMATGIADKSQLPLLTGAAKHSDQAARDQIAQLTEQLTNAKDDVERLTAELAEAQRALPEGHIVVSQEDHEALQANVARLTQELATAREGAAEAAEGQAQALRDAQARVAELTEQLAEAQRALPEGHIVVSQEDHEALQANVARLTQELATAREGAAEAAEGQAQALRDAQGNVERLTAELAEALQAAEAAEGQAQALRDAQGNIERLTAELATAREGAAEAAEGQAQALRDAQARVAELTEQLTEALQAAEAAKLPADRQAILDRFDAKEFVTQAQAKIVWGRLKAEKRVAEARVAELEAAQDEATPQLTDAERQTLADFAGGILVNREEATQAIQHAQEQKAAAEEAARQAAERLQVFEGLSTKQSNADLGKVVRALLSAKDQ
jgi:DNA repair exonuclease SbcCD ATPase subunit